MGHHIRSRGANIPQRYPKENDTNFGDTGASYIRFSYALPFSWLFVIAYQQLSGLILPNTTLMFWVWVSLAS